MGTQLGGYCFLPISGRDGVGLIVVVVVGWIVVLVVVMDCGSCGLWFLWWLLMGEMMVVVVGKMMVGTVRLVEVVVGG